MNTPCCVYQDIPVERRQIKYRAMKDDISDHSFVYGELIYSPTLEPRILVDREKMLFTTCIKGTECQFTGMRDRNGKEIYEFDIIRRYFGYNDIHSVVRFVHWHISEWRTARKINPCRCPHQHGSHRENIGTWSRCEVIGNILEHRDLLDKK